MRKTVYKLYWAWDFDREEKWLNEMSAKGQHLCGVGFCRYVFEEGAPGLYLYRLEMLDHWPSHPKSADYIRFVEDTGAEQIGAINRWVYFRKERGGSGFDIFSDVSSRIRHLDRILFLVVIFSALNLLNGLNQIHWGVSTGVSANLVIGMLCSALGLLLGYGFLRLYRKRRRLAKERLIRE